MQVDPHESYSGFPSKPGQRNLPLTRDCLHHELCHNDVRSESLQEKRERTEKGSERVVVTELSLDDWIAQQFGLDLENIPLIKPQWLPEEAHEHLKKYYFKFGAKKPLSPSSRKVLFPLLQEALATLGIDEAAYFKQDGPRKQVK